jgi:hypothetical protein
VARAFAILEAFLFLHETGPTAEPSTGTFANIYLPLVQYSRTGFLPRSTITMIGRRSTYWQTSKVPRRQAVVFHGVLSRHKLGISFLKFFQWFVIIFIIVVIGAGGTIIIVTVGGLVIGRGIENVGSRVILSLSSSAAAAGSNRLEWTAMKIQRHVVGAFITFKNPQQQVRQHSKLRSGGFFIISFISSFLGEDGRQSSISKTGGSTETDLMIVAKKEKKEGSIESNRTTK